MVHVVQVLRALLFHAQMFKGKENRLELIQELRTVHALQREEQELQNAEKELIMSLKKQRDNHRHEVKPKDIFIYKIVPTRNSLITPCFSPPRPLKRKRLRPKW